MKFIPIRRNIKRDFTLLYRRDGYSFDVSPKQRIGTTTLSIGQLQLDVDEDGFLLYPYGVCPLDSAQVTPLEPQAYTEAVIHVYDDIDPEAIPGTAYTITKELWPIYINYNGDWICIGNPTKDTGLFEFAPNCIASIDANKQLKALWLRPEYVD